MEFSVFYFYCVYLLFNRYYYIISLLRVRMIFFLIFFFFKYKLPAVAAGFGRRKLDLPRKREIWLNLAESKPCNVILYCIIYHKSQLVGFRACCRTMPERARKRRRVVRLRSPARFERLNRDGAGGMHNVIISRKLWNVQNTLRSKRFSAKGVCFAILTNVVETCQTYIYIIYIRVGLMRVEIRETLCIYILHHHRSFPGFESKV